jgi:hypothetical protein
MSTNWRPRSDPRLELLCFSCPVLGGPKPLSPKRRDTPDPGKDRKKSCKASAPQRLLHRPKGSTRATNAERKGTIKRALCPRRKQSSALPRSLSKLFVMNDLGRNWPMRWVRNPQEVLYSRLSGSRLAWPSPVDFFSQYFRTHASQLLPAAGSRPENSSAAISA